MLSVIPSVTSESEVWQDALSFRAQQFSSWPCTNCWADGVAQAEAAKEARLRGPQAFPLERLLAVYWALLRAHVDAPQPAAAEQSAELHMQLATMVELRLLSRVPPPAWM